MTLDEATELAQQQADECNVVSPVQYPPRVSSGRLVIAK
jgi:hypothetical protein